LGSGPIVDDVVEPGLRVVFCGTALGAASARARAYYAGPGNKFWPTLHAVGLTPRRLEPAQYREVLRWGIGLTDLCKTRSGSDAEIGRGGFDVPRLADLMEEHRPGWLALTSKRTAQEALGLARVGYGPLDRRLGGVPVWVLPSPSGAASGHWDIGPWRDLAARLA
jgi:TDG/mug DNA glycosylase family protein